MYAEACRCFRNESQTILMSNDTTFTVASRPIEIGPTTPHRSTGFLLGREHFYLG
jgi:hypothetical protein